MSADMISFYEGQPDFARHYWRAEDGRIYSSERKALVDAADPDFTAWREAGNAATVWPKDEAGAQTQGALDDVLQFYGVIEGEAPNAPLPDLSDRQFGAGLWGDGIISFEECDGFVSKGDIPPALQAILDTLPDTDTGEPTPRKEAIILVKGATSYEFDNPLVEMVRQAQDWTPEHLRDRWRAWATL